MKKITLAVVDDHRLIRDSWSVILNNDPQLEVIAVGKNGEEAIQIATTWNPDVMLMDINMSPIDGFEATRKISKLSPGTKIIALTMHNIPAYARKMLQMGAKGYLTKNSSRDEMIAAILEINKGKSYICHEVKDILVNQELAGEQMPSDLKNLSIREMGIIQLIKEGLNSKEISEKLSITSKTVQVHRYNILRKLSLRNTASLVNFVNHYGVLM